jgi:NADPH:quinone reductase-like Zn-dependent oxidoreductase
MRALVHRSYGGPEVLEVAEAPEPHAGRGQVRVAVRAASINPIDRKIISGSMADGPLDGVGRPGTDAAGVVDEVGDGVTGVSVGDAVFGTGSHTQAEYAVLNAWAVKPPSIDWPAAAAAGVAGETSERVLRLLDLPEGGLLFIDGGSGGVGAVAVQLAVSRGLRVIASAGPDNQDYLREIGAVPVVYGPGVADRVREAAGRTPDGVVDVGGRAPIEELIGLVPRPDRVVSIANFAAGEAGARVTSGGADARPQQALAEIAGLLDRGSLAIRTKTFPLERAAEAYRTSASGHVPGKLVLIP